MKRIAVLTFVAVFSLTVGLGLGMAAATKSYQFTGTVKSNEGGSLVVEKSATETWTFSTDKDTKGSAKVGDKVTVSYKMVALDIENKGGAAAPAKKAAKK